MKTLTEMLKQNEQEPIDDQWLNDEKPVMTADGRQAIVTDIDMSKVPNVVIGQVKFQTKLLDYQWEDNGECIKATDQYGNPKKPTKDDNLVKDFR